MSIPNSQNTLKSKTKPCPTCGNPMHRQSKMCRKCYFLKTMRPDHYIERICEKCGKTFTTHSGQVKLGNGKYCSRSCARSGSPTRKRLSPTVVCENCGKHFSKYKAEITKNKGDKHFCSPDCWYSYNQRDNHYLWTGGQDDRINPEGLAWRKAVLRRDKRHCRICRATKHLEVHHIYPFGTHPEQRWNIDNGLTLCHSCHVGFRNRELEYAEILKFIASTPTEVWYVY